MRTLYILLSLALSTVMVVPVAAHAAGEECRIATSSIEAAERIRGLTRKRPVPCFVHNADQVRGHLQSLLATKLPEGKLKLEEQLYKAIGLIPAEFNYAGGIIDLYVSQLGGYYDPDAQHFVMAGWIPAAVQGPIAVHELTHALQDQYFELSSFIDLKAMPSDALLARSALAEGDATAVMIDHARLQVGQLPIAREKNVEAVMMQNLMGASVMPGLEHIPDSMKAMLIFPYTSGLRFVHALLQRGGYRGVDAAFRTPPASTEEILHPEKYGQPPDFEVLEDSGALAHVGEGFKVLYGDTIGEFGISALLAIGSADRPAAARAAAGWGGDRATLLTHGERTVLIWRLKWDTTADAAEFVERYRAGAGGRGEVQQHDREVVFVRELHPPKPATPA